VNTRRTIVKPPVKRQLSVDLDRAFVRALADVRSSRKENPQVKHALDWLRDAFSVQSEPEGKAELRHGRPAKSATRRIEHATQPVVGMYFRELCDHGCDSEDLLWLIASCSEDPAPDPNRLIEVMGFDARQLQAAFEAIEKCARHIDGLNSRPVADAFKVASISLLAQLPAGLRGLVALLKPIAHFNWETYRIIAKRQLIRYVREKTGEYYDKKVSELIAVATDRADYDERAHYEFRRRNMGRKKSEALPGISSVWPALAAARIIDGLFQLCIAAALIKLSRRDQASF
jgi:hypothetical protein